MSDSGMGAPRDPADDPENEPGAIREGQENRRREDALANPDRDFAREQIDITDSEGPDLSGGDDVDSGAPVDPPAEHGSGPRGPAGETG